MLILPIIVALAAQSASVSPPPSPPWPQADQLAIDLKRACMSDAGVRIVVQNWERGQEAARAAQPQYRAVETELGEAAYTAPIDIDRLDRAARARNDYQAKLLADNIAQSIATLRQLSPADRAIYARRLAIWHPLTPARTC